MTGTDSQGTSDPGFERLQRLFAEACELQGDERQVMLDRIGVEDPDLRAELENLLAADSDPVRALEAPGAAPPSTLPADATDAAGLQIGPYRVLRVLGQGGMGMVYLAEQKEPFRRRVALKVTRFGIGSREQRARFDLERQALAVMNHEAIAKVFDAGTTENGQPFFAMELVEGKPLTTYCDEHRLSLRERISLFQKICAGVQHAHQKGVLHRDLKPNNILVSRKGDEHMPKIIDFGVARATGQQLLEETIFTEQGLMIGTPEYMSPEQAGGSALELDTRTDIYSLGVILYELLSGELPFPASELRKGGLHEFQRRVLEEEPPRPSTRISTRRERATSSARTRGTTVRALVNDVRGDLDWIVMKAMSKEPERRYESATGLAMDLQRHLEHEPVVAGPPSAAYRLRKLIRRYRGQVVAACAILATAVIGAVVAIRFALAADHNAELADRRATAEKEAREELTDKIREFDQLAAVVLYERAISREKELYPAWARNASAMQEWLDENCGPLLAMRPEIERTVESLRSGALPRSETEKQRELESHPRHAEWVILGKQVASLARAQAIRSGEKRLVEPELTAGQSGLEARALNQLAWDRVAPKAHDRKVWGEEALGLALARAASGKAEAEKSPDLFYYLDTLAWALLANGQDDEAKQQSDAALALAPAEHAGDFEGYRRELAAAVERAPEILADAESAYESLTAVVSAPRSWTFAPDKESERFLHDTLTELLVHLDGLASEQKPAVEQRIEWARRIGELTREHPGARMQWPAVREAIAESEKYRGRRIELRDEDVLGLVPLGANPVTGYFEFYHLRSAWDGKSDPATIGIPAHRADGSIEVTGETGIVFVLLPGGTYTMGAQKADPQEANYDPQAAANESPVHAMTIPPFFLARHEMTQGQWARLWTGEDSLRHPSYYKPGSWFGGIQQMTWSNPVEQVDSSMCDEILERHGLVLPTEAQWEYGCRGTTHTPWVCALAEIKDYANLADAAAKTLTPWICEEWNDGYVAHAPVGSFAANAFGLYDVHGNVWEWCLDEYGSYASPWREGDGLRQQEDGSGNRVYRGGAFNRPAHTARSAIRDSRAPGIRLSLLGLRPARALHP